MCGISGYIGKASDPTEVTEMGRRMATVMGHRGPDDEGVWIDQDAGVALSHRRLSILEISSAGHQPMVSHSGRYVIVFNGEIYNHLELRQDLEVDGLAGGCSCTILNTQIIPQRGQIRWNGHSDTETLLEAIEAWGVEVTLKRCVGMFAFALWDKQTHTLTLARDRMGEKPLYYGWQGDAFLFGSELKALKAHPAFEGKIDRDVTSLYFRHCYIPAPYSIYKGINILPPGTYLQVLVRHCHAEVQHAPKSYWDLRAVVEQGARNPFKGVEHEAVDELEHLLRQSIRGQMLSDVPVGAFLSGGIDSSTVVALMQAESDHPIRTFTIGFEEDEYNEADHASAVAEHLGTDHTELYVTAEQAMRVIPRLLTLYDEPYADSSQIPTFLVSELARKHVKVCLSGDGGDELFGGYDRYTWACLIYQKASWIPLLLRMIAAHTLKKTPVAIANQILNGVSCLQRDGSTYANQAHNLQRLATMLAFESPEALYLDLISHWNGPGELVLGATEPKTVLTDPNRWVDRPEFEHRMMYLDQISYLPDDILVKVDRAAMGVSLETRVPLLDHRIVEFAWRLPLSMKIHGGQSKWLLRQVLYRYVPRELVERPKMGFSMPTGDWLRGPLREWADVLLDEARIKEEGILNPVPIRDKWLAHLEGKQNWSSFLWGVLMFQAWLEAQR